MYHDMPLYNDPCVIRAVVVIPFIMVGVWVAPMVCGWLVHRVWFRRGVGLWVRFLDRCGGWVASRVRGCYWGIHRLVCRRRYNRRMLGEYLASLPPHSGLTYYEELMNEASSLPPGPCKLEVLRSIRRLGPPSEAQKASARAKAGMPVVNPGMVRALLRGDRLHKVRGW